MGGSVAPKSAKKGAGKRKLKATPKRKATKAASKVARKGAPKAGSRARKTAPKAAVKVLAKAASKGAAAVKTPAKAPLKIVAKGPMKGTSKGVPAPSVKGAKGRGPAGKGAIAGRHAEGDHEGLEFEHEPPVPVAAVEPPVMPTPSRRKPKPGSPDWPGESLTVGMEAPEFSLPGTLGRKVSLSEFRGKRVVLYFYPKDDTPGCTMEACAFRDNLGRIAAKDAVILGISLDDELSHQRFAQKYNLQFPLLSDVDAAVCRKYGTYKEKNLYGRSFWGVERTTFVIDREGKVENVFRRVKVEGHADEVLATLSV
jgi:peroxiredoxin Q/BCP